MIYMAVCAWHSTGGIHHTEQLHQKCSKSHNSLFVINYMCGDIHGDVLFIEMKSTVGGIRAVYMFNIL